MEMLGAAFLMFAASCVMSSCADDSDDTKAKRQVHLVLGMQHYEDTDIQTNRHALPTGFVAYEALDPQTKPEDATIRCYMTLSGTADPIVGSFRYNGEDWSAHVSAEGGSTYYIYGFMPQSEASKVSIAPYSSNYANGATMTITGLDAVTTKDPSVIVGVKGNNNNTDLITALDWTTSPRLGCFDYTMKTDDSGDYIYILVDHLYSALNFRFKVSTKYSTLRTIRLKEVSIMPYNDAATVKTVSATVDIVANNSGESPLAPVTWTSASTGVPATPTVIWDHNDEPVVLTTDDTDLSTLACIAPGINSRFQLKCTYDVYDADNTLLVKEDQTAQNIFTLSAPLAAGEMHAFVVTVDPTYLYVLAEPDFDNPTFTLE